MSDTQEQRPKTTQETQRPGYSRGSESEMTIKSRSAGGKRGRANKIYRTPVTPTPDELLFKEKTFVLDCNATSSISRDYCKANPKLGPVIPPYNSQRDRHVGNYFRFYGVNSTLRRTGQLQPTSTSIEGPVLDRFHEKGAGFNYLSLRNQNGAGHSQDTIDGHAQFMQGIRCVSGYNGKYGFRRNTPWLRKTPTPFEPATIFPTH
ncbi:uncharacterized protein C17orf98 [Aplysia californica]|uniref:Uncharacterized protein C17orf98 n=1 Tax=Aplysia californica TaxID=6500 RepID=A0ABM1A9H3_APLCA|nr:uncharacterized protein C17orf98 [Aplysia californica]XP_012943389.1 uncharacterized protein C17orf98 [Aplysia californica]